jgi:hypothetical protein
VKISVKHKKPITTPGMYAMKMGITQAITGPRGVLELAPPDPRHPPRRSHVRDGPDRCEGEPQGGPHPERRARPMRKAAQFFAL